VALRDEERDEDAVEDGRAEVTAPTEAIHVDEQGDGDAPADQEAEAVGATAPAEGAGPGNEAGPGDEPPVDGSGAGQEAVADPAEDVTETVETNKPLETVPAAVTRAPATGEPAGAAEPVAPDSSAAAETLAAAENAAATVVNAIPGALAGVPGGAGAADAAVAEAGIGAAGGGTGNGSWIKDFAGFARRQSWKIATAAGAAAVLVIVLVIIAANSSGSTAETSHKTSHKTTAAPVGVISVSPGNGSMDVNGASPVTVTYSGPIPKGTPLPTLAPRIAGTWEVSRDTETFTPQVGFTEDTHVTVTIPASAGTTATTTAATSFSFTTGHYSTLRLDELLSQLGYIPVTWTPADSAGNIPAGDASGQLAAAYDPPSGTFSFDSGYPSALTSLWSVGSNNEIIDGAVRTFEFDHNLTVDGDAGPRVWSDLLTAIARGERSQHGYTYVWVTQAGTEHLDLYHNGRLAITSPVNTGIAVSPTDDGTFPVYLRYTVTQMIGTNPDGSPYDDTVYWVSYFNGGDAVHAFPRASYGWYQSLGCVELPTYGSTAEDVWNLITYGTLVTVTGPVA
jgi:hypothetical protein